MMADAENLIGTGWIVAPNWNRVRIVTCNNLTIMVQCRTVSVGMDTNMRLTSIWKFNTFFLPVKVSS